MARAAGAETRLAAILSGVWVLIAVVFLASLVEQVMMTTHDGRLYLAGLTPELRARCSAAAGCASRACGYSRHRSARAGRWRARTGRRAHGWYAQETR
jgi:hypothetical protein